METLKKIMDRPMKTMENSIKTMEQKSWNQWKIWWTVRMRDFSYKMQQMKNFSCKNQGREPGRPKKNAKKNRPRCFILGGWDFHVFLLLGRRLARHQIVHLSRSAGSTRVAIWDWLRVVIKLRVPTTVVTGKCSKTAFPKCHCSVLWWFVVMLSISILLLGCTTRPIYIYI